MKNIKLYYLDKVTYEQSITIQNLLQNNLVNNGEEGFVLFVEYNEHIYTQGKNGDDNNILIDSSRLGELGIRFYNTDRGGDITYHGPGQIVCYPILNLKSMNLTVRKYVFLLEEIIMNYLCMFGISPVRMEGNPGLWVADRKISSIGVNIKKHITKHGFSINVNNELSYYDFINPCGFEKLKFTSVRNETGKPADLRNSYAILIKLFERYFNFNNIEKLTSLNLDNLMKKAL